MIDSLAQIFPIIDFCPGDNFCWSPQLKRITYVIDQLEEDGRWALLHETGHALLNHQSYTTDYELLRMEVAAWERAKDIANQLELSIDEDHIQECLDSYRDWLYKRSICPNCDTKTIQNDLANNYTCFNCHSNWQVTPSRFCRSYRIINPAPEFRLI